MVGEIQGKFPRDSSETETGYTSGTYEPVYCICRRPDRGDLMVQCDTCTVWYHGTCVGVTATEAVQMKAYICPPCCRRLRFPLH